MNDQLTQLYNAILDGDVTTANDGVRAVITQAAACGSRCEICRQGCNWYRQG